MGGGVRVGVKVWSSGQAAALFSLGLETLSLLTDALTHSHTHARTHSLTHAPTHSLTHSLTLTHSRPHALTHLGNWETDLATGLARPDNDNPDEELMLHEMLAAFVRLAAARYDDKVRAATKVSALKPLVTSASAPHPRLADKTEELLRAFVLPLEKELPVLPLIDTRVGVLGLDREAAGGLRAAMRLRQARQQ